MKKKNLLMTAIAIFGLATITMAQVPSYVPTNGLAGYWPFNGNTNDESGNGNNGIVYGALLTSDRNGIPNNSYSFDGISKYIEVPSSASITVSSSYSISAWFNASVWSFSAPIDEHAIVSKMVDGGWYGGYEIYTTGAAGWIKHIGNIGSNFSVGSSGGNINTWYNVVTTFDGSKVRYYLNGIKLDSIALTGSIQTSTTPLRFGRRGGAGTYNCWFNGKIDDIGIWNRALTQQEITNLYNSSNCASNLTVSPLNNQLQTGSTAIFTATTSDPNPSYVWQSDLGQGFQTLNNVGNYSGVNTASLNIANVQLSEHNQPIRVISTSGSCIDTSNVAVIGILDTCITNATVYDTLLTTVTDTLVINATITGLNPPNNLNTLKVYPNPTSTHITIDYGNFSAMSGYTLKITNALSQTVFTTPINQQSSYIDLSTWTGNGIYFVQIIDPQNNTIENRKIVIQ